MVLVVDHGLDLVAAAIMVMNLHIHVGMRAGVHVNARPIGEALHEDHASALAG
ncbi:MULTISPECIES: hypothetical protein [Sorangium]|uniref:hypothetical protein n=1 Tax=Sorangium TaxID=39643 RepID=UPI0012FFB07C|nr:hypothetical protein [Sorangium cellulosum]